MLKSQLPDRRFQPLIGCLQLLLAATKGLLAPIVFQHDLGQVGRDPHTCQFLFGGVMGSTVVDGKRGEHRLILRQYRP